MLERFLDDLRMQVEINTIAQENLRQEIDRLCQHLAGDIPVIHDSLREIKKATKPKTAQLKPEDVAAKCIELVRLDRSQKETITALIEDAGGKLLPDLTPENLQKVNAQVEDLINAAR